MLAERTALADIDDVEGFVAAARERAARAYGLRFDAAERTELLAEGLVLLYELAAAYEPRRAGYAHEGRFSGYASSLLPLRLASAWHDLHPEHWRAQGDDGSRHWQYEHPPAPLELVEDSVGTDGVPDAGPIGDRLEGALMVLEPWERFGVRRMVQLVAEGRSWPEVTGALGVDRGQLRQMRERLAGALERVEELEAA